MSNTLKNWPGVPAFPEEEWQRILRARTQLADEIISRQGLATSPDRLANFLGISSETMAAIPDSQRQAIADAIHMQEASGQFFRDLNDPGRTGRDAFGTSEYNDLLGAARAYGIDDPEKYNPEELQRVVQMYRESWMKEHPKGTNDPSFLNKVWGLEAIFGLRAVGDLIDTAQRLPFFGDALAKEKAVRKSDEWINMMVERSKMHLGSDWETAAEIAGRLGDVVPSFIIFSGAWKALGKLKYFEPVANTTRGTAIARAAVRANIGKGMVKGGLIGWGMGGGGDAPVSQRALDIGLSAIGGGLFEGGRKAAGLATAAFLGSALGGVVGGDMTSEVAGGAAGLALYMMFGGPAAVAKVRRSFKTRSVFLNGTVEEPGVVNRGNRLSGSTEIIPEADYEIIRGLLPPSPGEAGPGLGAAPVEPVPPYLPGPRGALPEPGPEGPIRLPGTDYGRPSGVVFEMGPVSNLDTRIAIAEEAYAEAVKRHTLLWQEFLEAGGQKTKQPEKYRAYLDAVEETKRLKWEVDQLHLFVQTSRIATKTSPSQLKWTLDPSQAPEVLWNLAGKGIKFSTEYKDGKIEVSFTNQFEAEAASGEYIHPEELAKPKGEIVTHYGTYEGGPSQPGVSFSGPSGMLGSGLYFARGGTPAKAISPGGTIPGANDPGAGTREFIVEGANIFELDQNVDPGEVARIVSQAPPEVAGEVMTAVADGKIKTNLDFYRFGQDVDGYPVGFEDSFNEMLKRAGYHGVGDASQINIFDKAEKLVKPFEMPGPSFMAVVKGKPSDVGGESEFTIGSGFDIESYRKKLRHDYADNMAVVTGRELFQNSVDALPEDAKGNLLPGSKITMEINTDNNSFLVVDNGIGMSPSTVGKQWSDFYASLKQKETSAGGFGIGTTGPTAISEHYELKTVWENPKTGKKIMTTSQGSGRDLLNRTAKVRQTDVPDSTPTGTSLYLEYTPEDELNFFDLRAWLGQFIRNSIKKIPLTVTINGREFDPLSDTYGFTKNAYKMPELQSKPEIVLKGVPGAEIEIWRSPKIKTATSIDFSILNNGIFQGSDNHWFNGRNVQVPENIVVNIKPTVKTESKDYPFTKDRAKPKTNIVSAIKAYIGAYELTAGKKDVDKLEYVLRNPVRLKGGPQTMGVYTSDPGITNDMLTEVINDYENKGLNLGELLAPVREIGQFVWALQKQLPWLSHMDQPEYGGLSIAGKALGLNIPLKDMVKVYDRIKQNAQYAGVDTKDFEAPDDMRNAPNRILYNPWISLYEVVNFLPSWPGVNVTYMRELPDGSTVSALIPKHIPLVAHHLAAQAWNTLVHEPIHQIANAHDEKFSGPHTRMTFEMGRYQTEPVEKLTKIMERLLSHTDADGNPAGLYEQMTDFSKHWTEENLFKEIVKNDDSIADDRSVLANRSVLNSEYDARISNETGNRIGLAPESGQGGSQARAGYGTDIQLEAGIGSTTGGPGTGVSRAATGDVLARDASQLTKREAILQSPILPEIAGHGQFKDVDVAKSLLASYPGQQSVIRNVDDVEQLMTDAKSRGMNTSNWQVVKRDVPIPGAVAWMQAETSGNRYYGANEGEAFLEAIRHEHDSFAAGWRYQGQDIVSMFQRPLMPITDVIVSNHPLTPKQVEQYKDFGIFSGMRVITPGGVEAVAGEYPHTIEFADGSNTDMIPWESVLPAQATQFVHDSPSAYSAFKEYVMDYMESESKRAGIPAPHWLGPEVSSQLPRLMEDWMTERGITGKDEQGLLELYFDRARIQDYKDAAPPEDKAELEQITKDAQAAVNAAYAEGLWNLDSTEELANYRGFDYDAESRQLINKFNGDKIPIESEHDAIEFLRNYQAEMPDATPTTQVPFEAIPTVPGGATLSDGHMPSWAGAEEFFDSMERTAEMWDQMFKSFAEGGEEAFLHGAKSETSGGAGKPPKTPPPPPPTGGSEIPPPEGRGEIPGEKETLDDAFRRLKRDDIMRYHAAADKANSILVRMLWGLRRGTISMENELVHKLGIEQAKMWRDLEAVSLALTNAHNYALPYFNEAREILQAFGRLHRRAGAVVHVEEVSSPRLKEILMDKYGYKPEEREAQAKIRPFFDKMHTDAERLLGRKIPYIFDYIPLLRKAQNFSHNPWMDFEKNIPTDLSWFALHARNYGVQARQLDIGTLMSIYIRGLFHEIYIREPWEAASNKWDAPNVPNKVRGLVHDWLEFVRTGINPHSDIFIQGIRRVLNKIGVPLTDGDMAQFWGISIANSYRGMMGWSPYHIFRDSIQPLLAGAFHGLGYARQAYNHWFLGGKAAKQEMWERALKYGWVEKGMTRVPNAEAFSQPVTNEHGIDLWSEKMRARRERAAQAIDWIYDHIPDRFHFGIVGSNWDPMNPYTKLGEFNRIIAGEIGWLRASEAINRYMGEPRKTAQGEQFKIDGTSRERLFWDSGAAVFERPVQDYARELIQKGEFEELAALVARETANLTQFRYGTKELPHNLRALGTTGRAAAMLGSFTNQWFAAVTAGLNPRNGGWEHAAAFAARYGIIQGAVTIAAVYTGWKQLEKLLWHKSATFAGGPILNWEIDMTRAAAAIGKAITGEMPSPSERAAISQFGIQNPFVAPWARGMKTVEGTMNSLNSINPIESTARFWATGEAGVSRDFRNYFNKDWRTPYENLPEMTPEDIRSQSETTYLSPQEEAQFQSWAAMNKISDVDSPYSYYDYRGYWKDVASKGLDQRARYSDGLHFPDTYKQHGHPTFSVESKYSRGSWDGGKWNGETFVPQGLSPEDTVVMNQRMMEIRRGSGYSQ